MGTINENYQLMFTSYPDVVNIHQLKEMLGITADSINVIVQGVQVLGI